MWQIIHKSLETKGEPKNGDPIPKSEVSPLRRREKISAAGLRYEKYREQLMQLAKLEPEELLRKIADEDPLQMNQFKLDLIIAETKLDRSLTQEELMDLFPCPDDRISLPDARNHTRSILYRQQLHPRMKKQFADEFTFLYFQHLRKAGGTNFCTLAEKNLPKKHLPRYYCMPDYDWDRSNQPGTYQCAGCLEQWPSSVIANNMKRDDHWVAGNEWEWFGGDKHLQLPAVFATSFRQPIDRAVSQFRFECVEHRGCKFTNITQWWIKRHDLWNVYVATFADRNRLGALSFGTSNGRERSQIMGRALDVLRQFHLVTNMEWLSYAGPLVKSVLGFDNVDTLERRVRPHAVGDRARKDGRDTNQGGSVGITKASWQASDYLDSPTYKMMSEALAMDDLLTHAARRFFIERLVCRTDVPNSSK